MGRRAYIKQRDLVDALLDYHARVMARHEVECDELRRLTALAAVCEANGRKDGNPERIAAILLPDADTSDAAD